ncbi:MAG: hypothetical protein K8R02_05585 [Anaerohalosphaeraceae bacterium]|nr:hypothetical protein [Anaerohalosphaeraceae bacterium]
MSFAKNKDKSVWIAESLAAKLRDNAVLPGLKRIWPDRIKTLVVPEVSYMPEASGSLSSSAFKSVDHNVWKQLACRPLDGSLNADFWQQAVCMEPDIPIRGPEPLANTKVYFCYDRDYLYVGVRAQDPPFRADTGNNAEDERRRLANEAIRISIDAKHDHSQCISIFANALGEVFCRKALIKAGFADWDYYSGDSSTSFEQDIELEITTAVCVGDKGWTLEMAIPFSELGVAPQPFTVMGLNVARIATELPEENYTVEYSWMDRDLRDSNVLPMTMGDMALASLPVSLVAIDFPAYTWGTNRVPIKLKNNTGSSLTVQITSRGLMDVAIEAPPYGGTHPSVLSELIELPSGEITETDFPLEVSVILTPQCMEFEIRNVANSELLYRAIYTFGKSAIIYPFGVEKKLQTPSSDDPDFIEKRTRFIVGQQPLFKRLTTRQSAESDFVLEAVDGSVHFNLMADGILGQIADWLCSIYDNDEDRLIGAAFFLSQPAVMTYSGPRASFASQMNSLTIIRCGGGICSEYGRAFVGLASRMKSVATGEHFKARCLMLKGHTLATVRMDDSWIPFDPNTNNVKAFWRHDHRSLANYRELATDPTLLAKNGSILTVFNTAAFLHYLPSLGNWPQGAPTE